ncbi:hypothetical protein OPIT5_27495 [Opitutaceae bacterium TAV5]|nr:hypothetical protein OPIT5_27495 [Opitutaceae bacterium TAV5]
MQKAAGTERTKLRSGQSGQGGEKEPLMDFANGEIFRHPSG